MATTKKLLLALLASIMALPACMTIPVSWGTPVIPENANYFNGGFSAWNAAYPESREEPPRYPYWAAAEGIEGRVLLQFSISREGRAIDVVVVASEPEGVFEQSALDWLKDVRWPPKDPHDADYPSPNRISIPFYLR